MKKRILPLCLLVCSFAFAQADIVFEHGNWQEILALAGKENKLIFLDAYTSWCGPCKVMAAKTFTDPAVADFYNAHFMNAKIDMEKGDGPALVERYDVRAFPTLLFVGSSGELVHKAEGALKPESFLALGNEVTDPHFASISYAKADYADHPDDRHVQAEYIARMTEMNENVAELVVKFQPSMAGAGLLDADSWTVFKAGFQRIDTDEARYFLAHHAAFVTKFGALEAYEKLLNLYLATMGHATYQHDEAGYMAARKGLLQSGHPEAEKMTIYQDIEWYLGANDWEKVIATIYHAVAISPDLQPNVLTSLADLFYKGATREQDLRAALEWSSKACAADPNYHNLDTRSILLHRLGQREEAIAVARAAIEYAKKAKEPYGETEDNLNAWLKQN